ncbi:hypothetical protein ES5_00647 [Dietzia cinnamea P4]|nr:hypothetical protein ES5_00647 [Dietzia cinnamea P4]
MGTILRTRGHPATRFTEPIDAERSLDRIVRRDVDFVF